MFTGDNGDESILWCSVLWNIVISLNSRVTNLLLVSVKWTTAAVQINNKKNHPRNYANVTLYNAELCTEHK